MRIEDCSEAYREEHSTKGSLALSSGAGGRRGVKEVEKNVWCVRVRKDYGPSGAAFSFYRQGKWEETLLKLVTKWN